MTRVRMRQCAREGGRHGFETRDGNVETELAGQDRRWGKSGRPGCAEQIGNGPGAGDPARFENDSLIERFERKLPIMRHRKHRAAGDTPAEHGIAHDRP